MPNRTTILGGAAVAVDEDTHQLSVLLGEELTVRVDEGSSWAVSEASAAAAARTVTRPGVAGATHSVQGFEIVVTGADTTVAITATVRLGATVAWRTAFGPAAKQGERREFTFPKPLKAAPGEAVSLEVSAGSVGVVTLCNLAGVTT